MRDISRTGEDAGRQDGESSGGGENCCELHGDDRVSLFLATWAFGKETWRQAGFGIDWYSR